MQSTTYHKASSAADAAAKLAGAEDGTLLAGGVIGGLVTEFFGPRFS